ncbi:MAG TPA: hypothetical protein VFE46_07475 [Pirellulales bacterium]|jgi:hypothetical protein|nr:hypothetical protein [Pirellulales bacterium]
MNCKPVTDKFAFPLSIKLKELLASILTSNVSLNCFAQWYAARQARAFGRPTYNG